MNAVRLSGVLVLVLALASCGETEPAAAPEEAPEQMLDSQGHAHRVVVEIGGSAHHTRTVADVTALTIFRFQGHTKANGKTRGHYFYNFQAAGFSIRGPITCITTSGNQAWIGGTVGSITSPDSADQSLVGVDMWWRMIDNGKGKHAPPDSTTGIGFAFPGSTISAESWCQDQPALLILREVARGDLKVKTR